MVSIFFLHFFVIFTGFPSEYWCDDEGIWDCPDGLDESSCGELGITVVKKATNVEKIYPEFQKRAFKAGVPENKHNRKLNEIRSKFTNNPKYWHKLRNVNFNVKKILNI